MDAAFQLAAMVAIIVGLAQFARGLIEDNSTDQKECQKEKNKLERDLIQLSGQVARATRAARYYKNLFEKENEFNNRLMKTLTAETQKTILKDTDRQKGHKHEPKPKQD